MILKQAASFRIICQKGRVLSRLKARGPEDYSHIHKTRDYIFCPSAPATLRHISIVAANCSKFSDW